MAEKIYVVQGSTGEYSAHDEWLVAAYHDEALAHEHAERAGAIARALYANRYEILQRGVNPYDAEMSIDYTGTYYDVLAVELRTALPEVKHD